MAEPLTGGAASQRTDRHVFVPGPSPLDCAVCGQPWRTTLRGPDPVHKRAPRGPRKDTPGREAVAAQEAPAPEGLRAVIEAIPAFVHDGRLALSRDAVLGALAARLSAGGATKP